VTRALVPALALVLLLGSPAHAETRRVAVVVGHNTGANDRAPLRYAESDAAKVAETLVELGGVEPADLLLLQGRPLASLRESLKVARARVAAFHEEPDARVVLLFYFSGHSDGESLELGRERLPFGELRAWLSATGAEVRLAIVDSCRSGALLSAKGPAVQLRLSDELASTGEALLTSSAADELALESRELRGSFFTHHLVSGLRGAADASGDGQVTLGEAYQYAFRRTVSATAGTVIGPQHPAYDYRLSGQGELVLATLERPRAVLELPAGFERLLIVRLLNDSVVAELPAGASTRLAVLPGAYAVRGWRAGRVVAARVTVAEGETRRVGADELGAATTAEVRKKGGLPELEVATAAPRPAPRVELVFAAGAGGPASSDARVLGSLRLAVRSPRASGWSVSAEVSSGRGRSYTETTALAFAGYRFGLRGRRIGGYLGLEAGAGLVSQDLDGGGAARSATVLGAPGLGGSLRLSARVDLVAEAHVPLGWIRRDGKDGFAWFPAGWLGIAVRP
jgi:hypothetical protein